MPKTQIYAISMALRGIREECELECLNLASPNPPLYCRFKALWADVLSLWVPL